jgi:hypothetical protein
VGDAPSNRVVVVARSRDGSRHALAIFDAAASTARAVDLPSGAFAANCSPALRILPLTLAARLALPISDRNETAAANPCAATGLLVFDSGGGGMKRVALPQSGTLDVNSVNVLNDYLYGLNADRLSQNASSVFIYDGVTETMRRVDAPRGAAAFTNIQPIETTGQLLALASNRLAGDEGLILFDLGGGTARLFPLPEGFARLANPGMHLATRMLTARGIKPGTEGSQIVVFHPASGAVTLVENPGAVRAIGMPAGVAAQTRLFWDRNQNSNSILTVAYGEGERPAGLVLVEGF